MKTSRSRRGHAPKIVTVAATVSLFLAVSMAWGTTIVIDPTNDSCEPADPSLETCAQACELDPAGCTDDIRQHINSAAFLHRAQRYPDTLDDDPNPTTPMHGLFNTMLVNKTAHDALVAGINDPFEPLDLPAWSIVAKFNHNPGNESWETHMYKIPGYCPKRAVVTSDGDGACIGGNWFWFLDRGGLRIFDWDKVYGGEPSYGKAETFCLDCHGAVTESDWLWRIHFSRIAAQQNLQPVRVDGEMPGTSGAEFCESVELSPVIPPDVRFDPATINPLAKRQHMFNCFSWLSFIAVNWPARSELRGVADTDAPFNAASRNRVWETYKQVYETFQPLDPNWKLDNKEWNEPQPLPKVCQQALADAPEGTVEENAVAFQVLNETHQAFGNQFNTLVDTNGQLIRYNIRFNRTEWEYFKRTGFANTGRYEYNGPGFPIVFPDNQTSTAVDGLGVTEFKSAWKELCTDASRCKHVDDPDRYYSRPVLIYEPAIKKTSGVKPESCRVAHMGLVGLHVIVKTFWAPQWIWYTFEHVDNVPRVGEEVNPNVSPNPYTLFNPQCLVDPPSPEECLGQTNPPICGQRPGVFGNEGRLLCCENLQVIFNSSPDPDNPPPACPAQLNSDPDLVPNQITRLDPIGQGPGDSIERTAALNKAFQAKLAEVNSPFQYYHLVNTQWPAGARLGTKAEPPYQIVQRLCLEGTPEPCFKFVPEGLRLRNTTMETYQVSYCKPDDEDISNNPADCTPEKVQVNPHLAGSGGCMNCHFPSGNDSSFVWSDAIEELVPLESNLLAGTVILATHGVNIGKSTAIISGSVVDNADRGKVKIGKKAMTPALFEIAGDRLRIKKGAQIDSDVAFNSLSNKGTINGAETSPLNLPVLSELPAFVVGAPGTQAIVVEQSQSLSLPPGNYGKLTAKRDASVLLSGGEYSFASIDAERNAKLLFGGSSQVTVKENVKAGREVVVGPTATAIINPADIVFYVNGGKVKFGKDSTIQANIYAPNGKISFKRADTEGAFIGAKVKTGKETEVILNSAFK